MLTPDCVIYLRELTEAGFLQQQGQYEYHLTQAGVWTLEMAIVCPDDQV
jgi:hypothetical protein